MASQRGAEGGYRLAREPDHITIADVIRALDGPLAEVRGYRPEATSYDGAAENLQQVWVAVRASLRSVLEKVTLTDVISGKLPPHVQKLRHRPGCLDRPLTARSRRRSTSRRRDYLWFVDLALREMAGIVEQLGDDLANRRPPFRDANSPYVILTHCLGVMEYWGGATVAERPSSGTVRPSSPQRGDVGRLLRRTEQARRRLRADIGALDAAAPPASVRRDPDEPVPYTETKGSVLLHILEELFQHLGQMEITRDALVTDRRR